MAEARKAKSAQITIEISEAEAAPFISRTACGATESEVIELGSISST